MEPITLSGRLTEDAEKLLPFLRPIVEVVAERSEEAKQRLSDDPATSVTRLHVYWGDGLQDFLSRALLQPYVALLRARKITPDRAHAPGHCPFCGGRAWISARRSAPDAESGFRYLECSLCGLEWNFNRINCPSCDEQDPYKLPIFQSDVHKTVRIETCETCRRYVKNGGLFVRGMSRS